MSNEFDKSGGTGACTADKCPVLQSISAHATHLEAVLNGTAAEYAAMSDSTLFGTPLHRPLNFCISEEELHEQIADLHHRYEKTADNCTQGGIIKGEKYLTLGKTALRLPLVKSLLCPGAVNIK